MKTALIAMAALAGIAAPAAANSITVDYAGLDLTSAAGQRTLERRIDNAARKVCEVDQPSVGTRIVSEEKQRCYEAARASAKARMAVLVADYQLGG